MNQARQNAEAFDLILLRYALERFLYRVSESEHRDRFVLKGAMLFQVWGGQVHRPTRDLDLLGNGNPDPGDFTRVIQDICETSVQDDGMNFQSNTVRAESMKEDEEYQGIRLKFNALLQSARVPIQIDVGFGDAITPSAEAINYPTLLDFPAPAIKAYPQETVVTEKFQAMVKLGIANSRMKDFFDIWTICQRYEFNGQLLGKAIAVTFERRQTQIPIAKPLALSDEFANDSQKQVQWKAFLNKNKLSTGNENFRGITSQLELFLMPIANSLASDKTIDLSWRVGGPWTNHPST